MAQNEERNTRSRRGESGRVRSPRTAASAGGTGANGASARSANGSNGAGANPANGARRTVSAGGNTTGRTRAERPQVSEDRSPVRVNRANSASGSTGGNGSGERRQTATNKSLQNHRNGRNGKNGSDSKMMYIGIAAIALIVIVCIALVVKFSGAGKGNAEETNPSETESTFAADEIRQPAFLDVSVLTGGAGIAGMTEAENATAEGAEASEAPESEGSTAAEMSGGISPEGVISLQGMTPEEVKKLVAEQYTWNMIIRNEKADVGATVTPTVDANATTEAATQGDAENPDGMLSEDTAAETEPAVITVENEIAVPDYVSMKLDELLMQIVTDDAAYVAESEALAASEAAKAAAASEEGGEAESETGTEAEAEVQAAVYTLSLDGLEDAAAKTANDAATMWYKKPKGGSIGSYDAANDKFIMEGAEAGFAVDEEALKNKILAAVASHDLEGVLDVPGTELSAEEATAASEYKIIGSYTTKTTSNSVRNKNIRLACEAINGTILAPGEEFSFNNVVGQRTEAKGYGAATAYNEGEVVQEVGGGICQVSTTLYNAVLRSGLKTTKRQSHTFEPNYVTPGMDATISWGGPDYCFANVPSHQEYSNSDSYSIGIKASYSNQQVTISIYGRPVLKDGYTYELKSKKVKETDIVRKKIEPGSDKTPTRGSKGSQWATNLVVKKNGEVVSDALDHNAYYSGHIEYYTDEPQTSETAASTDATLPSDSLPSDTLPQELMPTETMTQDPVYETGINGGPGVIISGGGEGPAGTTAEVGPGVTAAPQEPQTTAAPAPSPEPTAPQTSAAPAPAETPAPQAPAPTDAPAGPSSGTAGPAISDGPISDAPPAL